MKQNRISFRIRALCAAVLSTFFAGLPCNAADDTSLPPDHLAQIAVINKNIARTGALWVAARTSVSEKSDAEWHSLAGTDNISVVGDTVTFDAARANLPESLDWRSYNGDFVTGIRNQGDCGACWSFAMTGALESLVLRTKNTPNRELDLSEQAVLSCSQVGSCKGGVLYPMYLKATGVPPEEYYPYTATNGSCNNLKPGWQDHAHKIGSWGVVLPSVPNLKAALFKHGPVATAFLVYEDFMHYGSGIYSYTSGKLVGIHAVLLVGYNDAGQYFIVKNSWGPDWGENGFFRIAYSQINGRCKFGTPTITYYSGFFSD